MALFVYLYRRPQVPGCRTFAWVLLACGWWVFCYAMDLRSATAEERFTWVKLKYLGGIPANFLWLTLTIELVGKKHWLRTWWYPLLWIPAIGLILSVFTNDYHQLFWEPIEIKPGETHSGRGKGPGFQAYVLSTTFLGLTSVALIAHHSLRTVSFYRRRNLWLLLSFLSPYSGYWFELDQVLPFMANLDPVPLMLVPSSVFMAIAIFRYQAMDIVPLAQKMVFDSVHSAVVVIDPAMEVVATNQFAKTLWSKDDAEADVNQAVQQLAGSGLEDGAEIEIQLEHSRRWYLVIVSELANAREGQLGHSLVFVDITERKQQELERMEVMDARARFFASVSHELRSPLHAIRGLLEITMESELADSQRQRLEDAKASTSMLLALINNVLDESRLQADMMPLEQVPMELDSITNQLRAVHTYSAEKKGLELVFKLGSLGATVLGDPLRLTQVLTNLISNAIKFTESGSIELRIEVLHETATQLQLAFAVADTGIGISAEESAQLFTPFHQAELSTARRFGGTGLGLAISQALIARMGGEINLQSQPGYGSTFSFELKFAKAVRDDRQYGNAASVPNLAAFQILVVDDSDINLDILASQLAPTGILWDSAKDGAAALACASQKHYDLVLLDVHMPRMNGLEAVRPIKNLPSYQGVPVIAMSASVLSEDRQLARNAGFDGFLDKPFTFNELISTLRKFLLPGEQRSPENDAAPAMHGEIVDSARGIASLNGNKSRYLELLGALTKETHSQLQQLRACDDPVEQQRILHQLVGAAKLLQAESLARAAAQADASIAGGASDTEVIQRLDQLQAQNEELQQWVAVQD